MASTIQNNFRVRKNFAKIPKIIDIPNLIDIQKHSYEKFLQNDIPLEKREDVGLQGVFKSVFPIKDFNETASLEFVSLPPREAEVRRRRVPPARHDVRGPHQGRRPPGRVGQGRGDRRAVDPRREGAGGLLRRDPADDRERHLHHQRHRARRRQPAAPLARASSSTTTRARATRRASCSTAPASSRTAARGSTSSSTTRTCSTSASTAAASCTPRCCCARSADSTEELLNYYYDTETIYFEQGKKYDEVGRATTCSPASAPRRDIKHPKTRRDPRQEEPQVHQASRSRSCRTSKIERLPVDVDGARRQGRRRRRHRRDRPAKCSSQCNEELTEAKLDELREHGHRASSRSSSSTT